MHSRSFTLIAALIAGAGTVLVAPGAKAQANHYPAFQVPEITTREFNFAVAGGGDYGTTGLVQWREGIGPQTDLDFDLGFTSPSGTTFLDVGAGIGQQILHATQDTPIDIVLTGGLYGSFSSDLSLIRIPLGVSVGHRFPLQGSSMAITPFVHPRLSIDACVSDCFGTGTDLKVNFDVGADFEVSRVLSLRGALTVGGVSDGPSQTSFGIGLAFHPGIVRAGTR